MCLRTDSTKNMINAEFKDFRNLLLVDQYCRGNDRGYRDLVAAMKEGEILGSWFGVLEYEKKVFRRYVLVIRLPSI